MISNKMFNRWSVLLPISLFLILLCTAKSFDFTEDSVSLSKTLDIETPTSKTQGPSLRHTKGSVLQKHVGKAVVLKSLVAIIAVVAVSVLLVKCVRTLKKNTNFNNSKQVADGACLGLAGEGNGDSASDSVPHSQKPETGPGINYPVELDLDTIVDPETGESQVIKTPTVTKKAKGGKLGKTGKNTIAVILAAVVLLSIIQNAQARPTPSSETPDETTSAATTTQSAVATTIPQNPDDLKTLIHKLINQLQELEVPEEKAELEKKIEKLRKIRIQMKNEYKKKALQELRDKLSDLVVECHEMSPFLHTPTSLMPCWKLDPIKNMWNQIQKNLDIYDPDFNALRATIPTLGKECKGEWRDCKSPWTGFLGFMMFPDNPMWSWTGYVGCTGGNPCYIGKGGNDMVPSITRAPLQTSLIDIMKKLDKTIRKL